MSPYTYYYFFSVIAVLGIALFIVNLVYLRARGRTTFGLAYKPGSPEYRRGQKLACNRNLAISGLLALFLTANLVNSVIRIVRLGSPDAHFILIFAPLALVVFFGYMNFRGRQQFGNYGPGKGGAKSPDKK